MKYEFIHNIEHEDSLSFLDIYNLLDASTNTDKNCSWSSLIGLMERLWFFRYYYYYFRTLCSF